MNINWLEWLGYTASLIVLISLLMSSIIKLRWINLAGSLAFGTYGFLIGSLPTALMNLGIVVINCYYLVKIYGSKEYFQLLEMNPGSTYLNAFTTFYNHDIKKYFGHNDFIMDEHKLGLYILRNMVPAAIFIGNKVSEDTLEIELDYAVPAYRDFKLGQYLFDEKINFFKERGFTTLTATAHTEDHAAYLKKMGFESVDHHVFSKSI